MTETSDLTDACDSTVPMHLRRKYIALLYIVSWNDYHFVQRHLGEDFTDAIKILWEMAFGETLRIEHFHISAVEKFKLIYMKCVNSRVSFHVV